MDFGKFSPSVMGATGGAPWATVVWPRIINRCSVAVAVGDLVMFDMAMTASASEAGADGSTLPAVVNWSRGRNGVFGNIVKPPAVATTFAPAAYGMYGIVRTPAEAKGECDVMVAGECNVNAYSGVTSASVSDHPSGCVVGPIVGGDNFKCVVYGGTASTTKRLGFLKTAVTALSSVTTSSTSVAIYFNGITEMG